MITYFAFQDMNIKVDRPKEIIFKDKDIGNRCYERLKGIRLEDDWTKEMDEIIKRYNIKFEEATIEEMKKVVKTVSNIILRRFK